MRFERSVRPSGGLPELKTYRCFFCKEAASSAIEVVTEPVAESSKIVLKNALAAG
jgi:hypothetical protein